METQLSKKAMIVTYRQTAIHFETSGEGKPLILLHGFLEDQSIWQNVEASFNKNHQVVKIDLLGHGKTGCTGYIHTMEEMAEAVHAVFSKLKIEKASFIGHSMGGYIALAFAEKFPLLVEQIVLLNSTPAADSAERKENRDRAVALVKKNPKAFVSMAISNLLPPENSRIFEAEILKVKNEALKMPVQGIVAAIEGMKTRKDRTKFFKNFQNKKLVIAGKNDPVLPFENIKNIAEDCNCTFISLPGGHLSFIEAEKELLEVLVPFFEIKKQ